MARINQRMYQTGYETMKTTAKKVSLLSIVLFGFCIFGRPASAQGFQSDPLDLWIAIPQTFNGIAYGADRFVVVGNSGRILVSENGLDWKDKMTGSPNLDLSSIAYGNGVFVAGGGGLSDSPLFVSDDGGENWSPIAIGNQSTVEGIIFANGIFVAVGRANDGSVVLTSSDGVNWIIREEGTDFCGLTGVTYGNGAFVAVSGGGLVLTSPDGITWTAESSGFLAALNGITFGNGLFVAVGGENSCLILGAPPMSFEMILTSPDGKKWKEVGREAEDSNPLYAVAYGGGRFAAVGNSAKILISYDGLTWTKSSNSPPDISAALNGVAFGNDRFIAVGNDDTILQSGYLSGYCTASLTPYSDMTSLMYVPIIDAGGSYYGCEFRCEMDASSSFMCQVTSCLIPSLPIGSYADCSHSTLSSDLVLHIPAVIFNRISYNADLAYIPTTDGKIWVKLTSAAKN